MAFKVHIQLQRVKWMPNQAILHNARAIHFHQLKHISKPRHITRSPLRGYARINESQCITFFKENTKKAVDEKSVEAVVHLLTQRNYLEKKLKKELAKQYLDALAYEIEMVLYKK